MKLAFATAILTSLFMALTCAANGQVNAPTPAAAKDTGAAAALTQLFRVTGWSKQAAPRDALLSGTLTRHFPDGDQAAPFTMKVRGADQYDYLENGAIRFTANGTAGVVVGADGKAHRMPAQSAMSGRSLILPLSSTLLDWNAADVDVTLVGESSINGESCIGVQLARKHPDSASDPFAATRRGAAPLTIWISTVRAIPLRADYYRVAADNHTATFRETALFSDYRNVHGIVVPFRQDISIGGQLTYTFQFSDVQFNRGLTDSDFDVAHVAGGAQ